MLARFQRRSKTSTTDLLTSRLYNEQTFYKVFMRDLHLCTSEAIIESLFITSKIDWMHYLRFSAKPPGDLLEAYVTFATVEAWRRSPPDCRTLIVTCDFDREKLHFITSWMPRGRTVIIYDKR